MKFFERLNLKTLVVVAAAAVVMQSCGQMAEEQNFSLKNSESSSSVFVAIGGSDGANPERNVLYFSVPNGTSSVVFCDDTASNNCDNQTAGYSTTTFIKNIDSKDIYGANTPLVITEGKRLLVVATSSSEVSKQKIQFMGDGATGNGLKLTNDIALKGYTEETKLSKVFNKKYLVLEFSEDWCGGCLSLARSTNSDTSIQRLMDNDKCSHATFVGNIGRWNFKNTFIGNHSYGLAAGGKTTPIAQEFGMSISAYPTTAILEVGADGKPRVITKQTGSLPRAKIKELCQ